MQHLTYADKEYWIQRYASGELEFDWFLQYPVIRHLIEPRLTPDSSILVVGCGNSRMPMQLYEDGFHHVTAIDFAPNVIELMRDQAAGMEGLQYLTMDVSRLDFESETFDVIIDKGTLDSVLCAVDGFGAGSRMNKELCRVLKPGGVCFYVSYAPPRDRSTFLTHPSLAWSVEHIVVPKVVSDMSPNEISDDSSHHLYVCAKEAPQGGIEVSDE
jgi:ubiquinone/menaquinone biosynthesis C-methylase UbiE